MKAIFVAKRVLMKETDYYHILALKRDTTEEEIKRAYRRLAFQYHPDQNPMDEEAEEKFKEVSEAYTVLGDPEKRRVYDHYGYAGFRKHYASDDVFNGTSGFYRGRGNPFFFGRGCRKWAGAWRKCSTGHSNPHNGKTGEATVYSIDITHEEAVHGGERLIRARTEWNDVLFRLTIPAGIKNGTTITLKGENQASPNLHIKVNVKE